MRIKNHPILDFPLRREVKFTFEGREVTGYEGEPIAAALQAAGIRVLRKMPSGRPRGFFCAIGNCSSCYVVVDGKPNVRSCLEPVRDGICVTAQKGLGELR